MKNPLPALHYSRLWFGLGYAALAVVAVASLMPAPEMGVGDKWLHFGTYFVLSAWFTVLVRVNRQLIHVFLGLILFGVLIEFLQGLTGYRFMEFYDVLANAGGVVSGLLIRVTPLSRWFRRFESTLLRA